MKKNNPGASFCEMPSHHKTKKQDNSAAFYAHKGGFRWSGVKDEPYKTEEGGWAGIMRRVIIGNRGESAKFHVRYFEIAPGGNSSLETHRHEHVVICVKGEGVIRMGKVKKKMSFMDTAYVSPDTVHQLSNPFDEPFGFLCMVNAKRDRPKVITEARKKEAKPVRIPKNERGK